MRLESNLTRIALQAPAKMGVALLQTAADIVEVTKQLAPVDTGALRQSYGAVPISSTEVHIGSDLEYAPYQEYGTDRMAAQPHLTPAFMQAESTFQERLTQALQSD
jgi:HK97 gp10 family phage protein